MTSSDFAIEILEQHWIPTPDERDDLCSHGTVRVSIGGVAVIGEEDDVPDLGISRAALQLLRTLDEDHDVAAGSNASKLIPHSCGFLSVPSSCPIGIDWSVQHRDGAVTLDALTVELEISRPRRVEARADLPWTAYRDAVVGFARAAVEFVDASEKAVPADQWDRDDFDRWRTESVDLIARFEAAPAPDIRAR